MSAHCHRVRLPVRTTLLQNPNSHTKSSSFVRLPVRTTLLQNLNAAVAAAVMVRLPVRTTLLQNQQLVQRHPVRCDYQSERHCSKTVLLQSLPTVCAITSQNDTAPKQLLFASPHCVSAITSQNDTAPKPLAQNPHCKGRSFLTGSNL